MTTFEFSRDLTSMQDGLETLAKRLTGNADDAKDLLQETLLKALIYRDKFADNSNFKAWVYTIMKNIFINNYRRNKKTRIIFDQTDNLYYLNIGSRTDDTCPETIYHVKELQYGINELDCNFRRAFDMYNEGYKYKEIAEQLNMTIGAVKSRIFYSRQKLMRKLKEYDIN